LTGRLFRWSIKSSVVNSIVTEVALSHFGYHRAAILYIPVSRNFIKLALILTWFDQVPRTSVGKAFCWINSDNPICLPCNGPEWTLLHTGGIIAMPTLVFEKKPM
jgi:hypothetical protein